MLDKLITYQNLNLKIGIVIYEGRVMDAISMGQGANGIDFEESKATGGLVPLDSEANMQKIKGGLWEEGSDADKIFDAQHLGTSNGQGALYRAQQILATDSDPSVEKRIVMLTDMMLYSYNYIGQLAWSVNGHSGISNSTESHPMPMSKAFGDGACIPNQNSDSTPVGTTTAVGYTDTKYKTFQQLLNDYQSGELQKTQGWDVDTMVNRSAGINAAREYYLPGMSETDFAALYKGGDWFAPKNLDARTVSAPEKGLILAYDELIKCKESGIKVEMWSSAEVANDFYAYIKNLARGMMDVLEKNGNFSYVPIKNRNMDYKKAFENLQDDLIYAIGKGTVTDKIGKDFDVVMGEDSPAVTTNPTDLKETFLLNKTVTLTDGTLEEGNAYQSGKIKKKTDNGDGTYTYLVAWEAPADAVTLTDGTLAEDGMYQIGTIKTKANNGDGTYTYSVEWKATNVEKNGDTYTFHYNTDTLRIGDEYVVTYDPAVTGEEAFTWDIKVPASYEEHLPLSYLVKEKTGAAGDLTISKAITGTDVKADDTFTFRVKFSSKTGETNPTKETNITAFLDYMSSEEASSAEIGGGLTYTKHSDFPVPTVDVTKKFATTAVDKDGNALNVAYVDSTDADKSSVITSALGEGETAKPVGVNYDGNTPAVKDGEGHTITPAVEGYIEVKLHGGESLTIKDLPAGWTYSVQEVVTKTTEGNPIVPAIKGEEITETDDDAQGYTLSSVQNVTLLANGANKADPVDAPAGTEGSDADKNLVASTATGSILDKTATEPEGLTKKAIFTNTKNLPGMAFSFTKVAAEDNSKTFGKDEAKFKLFTRNKGETQEYVPNDSLAADTTNPGIGQWTLYATGSTDASGNVSLERIDGSGTQLENGEYYLVETKAPLGYKLPSGQWKITINGVAEIENRIDPVAVSVNDDLPPAIMRLYTVAVVGSESGETTVVTPEEYNADNEHTQYGAIQEVTYKVPNVKHFALPFTGNWVYSSTSCSFYNFTVRCFAARSTAFVSIYFRSGAQCAPQTPGCLLLLPPF